MAMTNMASNYMGLQTLKGMPYRMSLIQENAVGMPLKDRINDAMEAAGMMKFLASISKQLGLNAYAKFLIQNARKAKRWAAKGGNTQYNSRNSRI